MLQQVLPAAAHSLPMSAAAAAAMVAPAHTSLQRLGTVLDKFST
jgi:hypothetical protein